MYAIVDIETTGGYAAANDITEIAILLHDGTTVTDHYETLIKPSKPIPYFIQSLTGINNDMVKDAPDFAEVALDIFEKLNNRIFVAHNVNFDYSFLKHHLSLEGLSLNTQKLCTVRLSRKVFPSLASYSLGNICRHFGININNRHRAGGDAEATATLFEYILANNGIDHIQKLLKKRSGGQSLPPHLPKEQIDILPYCPGVYYFHDQKGKIIYVGKARNIKYRVSSHFTHNGAGRQRQEFLRNIHSITYQQCGTELMAFVLENVEIRKYWPKYNVSQKSVLLTYGIYMYEDRSGYYQLVIEKKKPNLPSYYTFNVLHEGQRVLQQLHTDFLLERTLDDIPSTYNKRVEEAIDYLQQLLPTFAVVEESYDKNGKTCLLIEKGKFYGMGYVPEESPVYSIDELKEYLSIYPENDYIRGLVYQYAQKNPGKKLIFNTV